MTKKVLISLSQLQKLCSPDSSRPPNEDYLEAIMQTRMRRWFDAQQNASNLEKIILAYEQATDISPEELNIRDEE